MFKVLKYSTYSFVLGSVILVTSVKDANLGVISEINTLCKSNVEIAHVTRKYESDSAIEEDIPGGLIKKYSRDHKLTEKIVKLLHPKYDINVSFDEKVEHFGMGGYDILYTVTYTVKQKQ